MIHALDNRIAYFNYFIALMFLDFNLFSSHFSSTFPDLYLQILMTVILDTLVITVKQVRCHVFTDLS